MNVLLVLFSFIGENQSFLIPPLQIAYIKNSDNINPEFMVIDGQHRINAILNIIKKHSEIEYPKVDAIIQYCDTHDDMKKLFDKLNCRLRIKIDDLPRLQTHKLVLDLEKYYFDKYKDKSNKKRCYATAITGNKAPEGAVGLSCSIRGGSGAPLMLASSNGVGNGRVVGVASQSDKVGENLGNGVMRTGGEGGLSAFFDRAVEALTPSKFKQLVKRVNPFAPRPRHW